MHHEFSEEDLHALDAVWHELIKASQRMNEVLWQGQLKDASMLEISILSIVEREPDAMLRDIIKALGIPGSTLTSAIDRLEKRGLIRREISAQDRRSFSLRLTPEGVLAQQQHRRDERMLLERVLSAYASTAERHELIRLLGILARSLTDMQKEGEPNDR